MEVPGPLPENDADVLIELFLFTRNKLQNISDQKKNKKQKNPATTKKNTSTWLMKKTENCTQQNGKV